MRLTPFGAPALPAGAHRACGTGFRAAGFRRREGVRGKVLEFAGPWRTSGDWWTTKPLGARRVGHPPQRWRALPHLLRAARLGSSRAAMTETLRRTSRHSAFSFLEGASVPRIWPAPARNSVCPPWRWWTATASTARRASIWPRRRRASARTSARKSPAPTATLIPCWRKRAKVIKICAAW